MLFFTARAAPDPAGLVLDAVGAARQQAMRLDELRAAAGTAARILARVRQERQARR